MKQSQSKNFFCKLIFLIPFLFLTIPFVSAWNTDGKYDRFDTAFNGVVDTWDRTAVSDGRIFIGDYIFRLNVLSTDEEPNIEMRIVYDPQKVRNEENYLANEYFRVPNTKFLGVLNGKIVPVEQAQYVFSPISYVFGGDWRAQTYTFGVKCGQSYEWDGDNTQCVPKTNFGIVISKPSAESTNKWVGDVSGQVSGFVQQQLVGNEVIKVLVWVVVIFALFWGLRVFKVI